VTQLTVPEGTGYVAYTIGATPSTGPFVFNNVYFLPSEVAVFSTTGFGTASAVQTPLVSGTDYNLVGQPADDGYWSGTVTLLAARSNVTIEIQRTLADTKATNFPITGAISIFAMNTLFSRLFSWVQDLRRLVKIASNITYAQIVAALGYTPANKAGDTFTGDVTAPDLIASGTAKGAVVLSERSDGVSPAVEWHNLANPTGYRWWVGKLQAGGGLHLGLYQDDGVTLIREFLLGADGSLTTPSGIVLNSDKSIMTTTLAIGTTDDRAASTKFVNQVVGGIVGGLLYQGTWNASTNVPHLASGVGTPGTYYAVAVAGSTMLDGAGPWHVGDWVVFSGGVSNQWQMFQGAMVAAEIIAALGYTPANQAGDTFGGVIAMSNAAPSLQWNMTGNGADLKNWRMTENAGGQLVLSAYTDAGVIQNSIIFNRDGTIAGSKPTQDLTAEVVLAAPANQITIAFPTGARVVELWFDLVLTPVANNVINLKAVQNGVPNVGASSYSYGYGALYSLNSYIATQATGAFVPIGGSLTQARGMIRLTNPGAFNGNGNWSGLDLSNTFYNYMNSILCGLSGVNGFQVTTASNFATGSYLRILSVT
jgi:hypothetical protein